MPSWRDAKLEHFLSVHFSSPPCQDQVCCSPSLLFSGYQGLFPQE